MSDAHTLAMLHAALVNQRHGIITSLLEEVEHPAARGLFVFNAMTVDCKAIMLNPTHQQMKTERHSLAGSGAAFDRASALWAAFGEAVERYSAAIYDEEQLHYASEYDLKDAAVSLDDFILYSPEQYAQNDLEFSAPDKHAVRAWSSAINLAHPSHLLYVPAQMVYLGMRVKQKAEIVSQSSSTGLACGMHIDRVMLSGLCEVIERDAFAAMWQMRYAPRRLHLTDLTMAMLLPGVREILLKADLDITLWDITTDIGLPVVLSLARNRQKATMSFGASAHLDIHQAINKAVTESMHGYIWAHSILAGDLPIPDADAIQQPGDHFAYYLRRERQDNLAFLFENQERISSDDSSLRQLADIDALIQRLDHLGYQPLISDVTSPDIGALGFHVIRALIPGLQPLLFGSGLVSGDIRRLQRIANYWGLPRIPAPNLDPHPFP